MYTKPLDNIGEGSLPPSGEINLKGMTFMVYVKSMDGKALMPTSNAKARKLLKQKKAKVVRLRPFVIKLTYKTKTEYTQKLNFSDKLKESLRLKYIQEYQCSMPG